MNRRQFIKAGAAAATSALLPSVLRSQSVGAGTGAASATLSIHSEAQGVKIPLEFTGVSYESAQLAHPQFFSAKNKNLVALYRRLGAQGVLRIGGNTSEYTLWNTQGAGDAKDTEATGPFAGLNIKKNTPVTPAAIKELSGFLEATGWKLIYGLNLGHGSPEEAAEEGAYVAKVIRSRLIALQIGNEPDLYHRNGLRSPNYGYDDYWKEWTERAQAVRKRTPGVPLAGPDVGNRIDWVEQFAKQSGDEIVLLTSHYYAEGPPSNPQMNIERLLKPRPKTKENIARLLQITARAHLPYRMSEGNSCYHGGKPGVSDAFASALWGADYMLLLAQAGVTGVNFHGGGNGYYTPIAGNSDAGFSARPLYYGMLLFSSFAGSTIIPSDLDSGGVNLTAYAGRNAQGKLQAALINKDLKQAAKLNLKTGIKHKKARVIALSAPSAESKSTVTLGGAEVTPTGAWKAKWRSISQNANGEVSVDLPAASAALVLLE